MNNYVEMECNRCPVTQNCSKYGNSPMLHGKNAHKCKVFGGFSRKKVDPSILSPSSALEMEKNGPYLTIIEVPSEAVITPQGTCFISRQTVKVFHQLVNVSKRPIPMTLDRIIPKSHR